MERTYSEQLTSTAYHEAAHAVIALDLGIPVHSMSIMGTAAYNGVTRHGGGTAWIQELDKGLDGMNAMARRRLEAFIMMSWAGREAQRLYLGLSPAALAEGFGYTSTEDGRRDVDIESDIGMIVRLSMNVIADVEEVEAYIEWLRRRTRSRLKAPHIQAQVEAVAHALLRAGRLERADIRRISQAALVAAAQTGQCTA